MICNSRGRHKIAVLGIGAAVCVCVCARNLPARLTIPGEGPFRGSVCEISHERLCHLAKIFEKLDKYRE